MSSDCVYVDEGEIKIGGRSGTVDGSLTGVTGCKLESVTDKKIRFTFKLNADE